MVEVLVAGLAAVWGWQVLNMPAAPPPISWISSGLRRLPRGDHLVGCPFCIGAWLAIVGVLVQTYNHLSWTATPVACLAAAGLTGIIGTLLPHDGTPTE